MNSSFSEIVLKIKERNYIKWMFWIMVFGYVNIFALFIVHDLSTNWELLCYIVFFLYALFIISAPLAFLTEFLLLILFPIAMVTKKFKFPLPEVYFLIPLLLLLFKVSVFMNMNE